MQREFINIIYWNNEIMVFAVIFFKIGNQVLFYYVIKDSLGFSLKPNIKMSFVLYNLRENIEKIFVFSKNRITNIKTNLLVTLYFIRIRLN